ncbi:MAG: hypothetical protein JGK27_12130 [Microcoleus sp. PH2017_20_SFW_D_A]|nr:hypothetical protein [Microcoleus sp. PH2017_28_MFU_U_A]MCC3503231.1 hypothetical protein [Microcoleus sp. PH2017_19_SFW_U_A]MCC3522457.1 hypothetical protein [Microcoleus sp. PH2017_20_SFW_D_A]MCC3554139.1 hypothetical protein [Microcoleus sp. PH2017_35_SFW_U_B]
MKITLCIMVKNGQDARSTFGAKTQYEKSNLSKKTYLSEQIEPEILV